MILDFQTAFYQFRESTKKWRIWIALCRSGIPDKLIDTIRVTYDGAKCLVQIDQIFIVSIIVHSLVK